MAIAQVASAMNAMDTRTLVASSVPIEGALTLPWSVVVVGSRPGYWWASGSSTFLTYLANMAATPQPWRLLPYCGGSTSSSEWGL